MIKARSFYEANVESVTYDYVYESMSCVAT